MVPYSHVNPYLNLALSYFILWSPNFMFKLASQTKKLLFNTLTIQPWIYIDDMVVGSSKNSKPNVTKS